MPISNNDLILGEWEKYLTERGVSEDIIKEYLDYASNILYHKGCIIMDDTHFCLLNGIKKEVLYSMVYGTQKFYYTFNIKKHSGGLREICAPYPSLKVIQTWIYENILEQQKVNGCSHGFRNKRSIVTNAKYHLQNDCLLKIDLKDFFPSIKIEKVVQVFKEIGYSKEVAFILSRLCCLNDELPQGAPTSPCLSNIICRQMDKRLFLLAKSLGFNYTRYADDIAFSGKIIPPKFIDYVKNIIEDCGFTLNVKKTRLYKKNNNKILTGICLRDGEMRLPREKRRQYELDMYYTIKYGLDVRIKGDITNLSTYILSQLGKANFWHMIEPKNDFVNQAIPKLKSLYEQAVGFKDGTLK